MTVECGPDQFVCGSRSIFPGRKPDGPTVFISCPNHADMHQNLMGTTPTEVMARAVVGVLLNMELLRQRAKAVSITPAQPVASTPIQPTV